MANRGLMVCYRRGGRGCYASSAPLHLLVALLLLVAGTIDATATHAPSETTSLQTHSTDSTVETSAATTTVATASAEAVHSSSSAVSEASEESSSSSAPPSDARVTRVAETTVGTSNSSVEKGNGETSSQAPQSSPLIPDAGGSNGETTSQAPQSSPLIPDAGESNGETTSQAPQSSPLLPDAGESNGETSSRAPQSSPLIPDAGESNGETTSQAPQSSPLIPDAGGSNGETTSQAPQGSPLIPDAGESNGETSSQAPQSSPLIPDAAGSNGETTSQAPQSSPLIPDAGESNGETSSQAPQSSPLIPDAGGSNGETSSQAPQQSPLIPETGGSNGETTSQAPQQSPSAAIVVPSSTVGSSEVNGDVVSSASENTLITSETKSEHTASAGSTQDESSTATPASDQPAADTPVISVSSEETVTGEGSSTTTVNDFKTGEKDGTVITRIYVASDLKNMILVVRQNFTDYLIASLKANDAAAATKKRNRREATLSGEAQTEITVHHDGDPTGADQENMYEFKYFVTRNGVVIPASIVIEAAEEAGKEYEKNTEGKVVVYKGTRQVWAPHALSTTDWHLDNKYYVTAILSIIGALVGIVLIAILVVWLINRRRAKSFSFTRSSRDPEYGYKHGGVENPVMAEEILAESRAAPLSSKPSLSTNGHTSLNKTDDEAMIIPLDQLQAEVKI